MESLSAEEKYYFKFFLRKKCFYKYDNGSPKNTGKYFDQMEMLKESLGIFAKVSKVWTT